MPMAKDAFDAVNMLLLWLHTLVLLLLYRDTRINKIVSFEVVFRCCSWDELFLCASVHELFI